MDISPTQSWLILGVILIIVELLTTTFVVLFFGVSALVVALMSFLGVTSLTIQLFVFAIVGVLGIVGFREKIRSALNNKTEHMFDGLRNTSIILDNDIASRGTASIMHQGTTWTAINDSENELKKGDRVAIVQVEGVKLIVRKI